MAARLHCKLRPWGNFWRCRKKLEKWSHFSCKHFSFSSKWCCFADIFYRVGRSPTRQSSRKCKTAATVFSDTRQKCTRDGIHLLTVIACSLEEKRWQMKKPRSKRKGIFVRQDTYLLSSGKEAAGTMLSFHLTLKPGHLTPNKTMWGIVLAAFLSWAHRFINSSCLQALTRHQNR